jgi:hypothetical protein
LNVSFDWSYENSIAEELTDFPGRSGYAILDSDGTAWKVVDASITTPRVRQHVCP